MRQLAADQRRLLEKLKPVIESALNIKSLWCVEKALLADAVAILDKALMKRMVHIKDYQEIINGYRIAKNILDEVE